MENHCDGDTLIKYKVNEYISTSAPGYSHSHSITATAAAATTNIIIFWKRSTTFCEIYSILRYFQSLSLLFSMYYALTAFCNQCDVGYRSFFPLLSFYLRLSLSLFSLLTLSPPTTYFYRVIFLVGWLTSFWIPCIKPLNMWWHLNMWAHSTLNSIARSHFTIACLHHIYTWIYIYASAR